MRARLWSFKLRLGFALRALRPSKRKPTAAEIRSVSVALVMVVGAAASIEEACRAARREVREAGIVDPSLDSALASIAGVADGSRYIARREMTRLGIQ